MLTARREREQRDRRHVPKPFQSSWLTTFSTTDGTSDGC